MEDNGGNLQSIGLTGVCGNLIIEIFEKSKYSSDYVYVKIGSLEKLKEVMIISVNHKLDIQVTLTAMSEADDSHSEWIILR